MQSDSLKGSKNTENINPRLSKTSNGKQCYHQNVQYVVVKNQVLVKNKKQKGY